MPPLRKLPIKSAILIFYAYLFQYLNIEWQNIISSFNQWSNHSVPAIILGYLAFYWTFQLFLFILEWHNNNPAVQNPWPIIGKPEFTKPVECNSTLEKFCLIGAGPVGLATAGALVRHGIPFDCYDSASESGGNWDHGVYHGVRIISSKLATELKDWPMPEEFGPFPTRLQMRAYFQSYGKHYGITPKFNTTITQVEPIYDKMNTPLPGARYFNNKGFKVTFADGSVKQYKGVIAAVGHHRTPRWPTYPGLDKFKGKVIHSSQFTSQKQVFSNVKKGVAVIGTGNSGCDMVMHAAIAYRYGNYFSKCDRVISQLKTPVYWSIRTPTFILPRSVFGTPLVDSVQPWMPLWFQKLFGRFVVWYTYGRLDKYGLKEPPRGIFESHPTIHSGCMNALQLRDIEPHDDIKQFVGDYTVEFKDGSRREIDLLICGTGFLQVVPPYDKSNLLTYVRGVPQLISGMFHPNFQNLYAFGLGQVRSGLGCIVTYGAEYLARSILIQEKLRYPIGYVFNRLGIKASQAAENTADIIIDPHKAFQSAKMGLNFLPWVPFAEKAILPNDPSPENASAGRSRHNMTFSQRLSATPKMLYLGFLRMFWRYTS